MIRKDPWCLLGDFNSICSNDEKLGGPSRCDSTFLDFNNMLKACEMNGLASQGNPFTWSGKRGKLWIQCKLDRCFGNKGWLQLFPGANQVFLDKRGSDHRPVLVNLVNTCNDRRGRFRFDKSLLNLPNVKTTVINAWKGKRGKVPCNVAERVRRCIRALCNWKRNFNLNARDKILRLQEELEVEESRNFSRRHIVLCLKQELMKAYREEESFWNQRSKEKWVKCGDKNSKFFHASVKTARSKNRIDILEDKNGMEHRAEASKGEIASSYFQELFSSINPSDFGAIFEGFTSRVTVEMNEELLSEISNEEIREAVFSIRASSAPGPDGMTGLFYQKFWSDIGDHVASEVKEFFRSGSFTRDWNFTHLCLIPKIVKPTRMTDLRPISLCSVFYKIISKIMVKRLQPMLPLIVSPNQSAFVPERQISDNILVAHEVVHGLRTFKPVASEYMAIKSDMSTAYDRVEWKYIRCLLLAMGFQEKWVDLVMFCISSVSYSVLINDQPHGLIIPQRGLRQGDPMSPALFVLCAEGLSHLLARAEEAGILNGIKFSEQGPSVSHLLFADDSLFLCKAQSDQPRVLQEILNIYGEATGQVINLQKPSVTFGAEVKEDLKGNIREILGIFNEGGAGTYLGSPECFSGSKVKMFDFIKRKLKRRLSGWFERTLSLGGKEILLKAVALAFPVFAMSCFKLPKTTISNFTGAMADFWWSSLEHKRKIHWLKWDKLCLPKELGGLGFKDFQSFNQALLAKQVWKLLQNPDSMIAKMLKSRYFESVNFLEAGIGSRPSNGWRSILFGRELLIKGLRKEVGNGRSLRVWTDPWCDFGGRFNPWMMNPLINLDIMVSELLDQETGEWKRAVLEENFFPGDVEVILKTKAVISSNDFWCWKHNKSGEYSVRSGNWLACNSNLREEFAEARMQPSINCLKGAIWNVSTEPKIKTFMWRALSEAIPVATTSVSRGMKMDLMCQHCGIGIESPNHVLFSCSVARQVWALSSFPVPQNGFHPESIFVNMFYLNQMSKNIKIPFEVRRNYPWTLWLIWKNINKFMFEGCESLAVDIVDKIYEEASVWFLGQQLDREDELVDLNKGKDQGKKWMKPPDNWIKCNFGVHWEKKSLVAGVSWIVRDKEGETIMHSRRSFVNIFNLKEAKLKALCWTLESMAYHRFDNVIFAGEDAVLLKVIDRLMAWPSFKFELQSLQNFLSRIKRWKVKIELRCTNRCAFLIARSATLPQWGQSYVARSSPRWLSSIVADEKR